MPFRVIRETLLLDILRDRIGDENSVQDLMERELALDKALIQLIRHACESNRQARALDFVRLLHRTPFFDAAIKIAKLYSLTRLQEIIEWLKAERGSSVSPECLASCEPPKPSTMKGTTSVGSLAREQPANNDCVFSADSDAKQRTVRGPASSATAINKTGLPQSREYSYLLEIV